MKMSYEFKKLAEIIQCKDKTVVGKHKLIYKSIDVNAKLNWLYHEKPKNQKKTSITIQLHKQHESFKTLKSQWYK